MYGFSLVGLATKTIIEVDEVIMAAVLQRPQELPGCLNKATIMSPRTGGRVLTDND